MFDDLSLFSVVVVLFLMIDPIGNIGSYLTLMRDVPTTRRKLVLFRELGIALAVMLLFNYIGEHIFSLLGLSEITVSLASGVILFLVAIKILFGAKDNPRANLPSGEPFITPLAIPLIAGPALLATIMLYAHMEPSQPLMLAAIFISSFLALLVFLFAPYLHRFLGNNGLIALEKLMGMILALMAVQRFAEGVQMFIARQYG